MFKVAKSIQVSKEKAIAQVVEAKIGHFDTEKKKTIYKKQKELEITVTGFINNEENYIHFILNKPLEEILAIKNFQKIDIKKNEIIDNYLVNDGKMSIVEIENLEILRFSKSFIISFNYKTFEQDFFGLAEIEVEINTLTETFKSI